MKNDLTISLVQTNLYWEDKTKNLAQLEKQLAKIKSTDLIVLPEMFTTGFSMNAKALAETMDGPTVLWMKQKAKSKKAAICGSIIVEEKKKYYNRFCFVLPNGDVFTYDKRHLFSPAGENQHYSAGKEKIIVQYKDWNICPLVCYDLRFPVWSRIVNNEFDVLLYVANWPTVRNYAWEHLLIARAIENQSYVVGVNRVGKDAKGNDHNGSSCAVDMLGKVLAKGTDGKNWIKTLTLNKKNLEDYRDKLAFAKDADHFIIDYRVKG